MLWIVPRWDTAELAPRIKSVVLVGRRHSQDDAVASASHQGWAGRKRKIRHMLDATLILRISD
jgi:hypothetical protein